MFNVSVYISTAGGLCCTAWLCNISSKVKTRPEQTIRDVEDCKASHLKQEFELKKKKYWTCTRFKTFQVLTHREQADVTSISDVNMQLIHQEITSIHTEHDTDVLLEFNQRIKSRPLSVAPEKNKGRLKISHQSDQRVMINTLHKDGFYMLKVMFTAYTGNVVE